MILPENMKQQLKLMKSLLHLDIMPHLLLTALEYKLV
jgi:hypothetical protein